jgi:hypothetical protein
VNPVIRKFDVCTLRMQRRAGAGDEVRETESVADLDELASAPDHLAAAGQHRHREQECRRPVVDGHDIAGIGQRGPERGERAPASRGTFAIREVVFDIDISRRRDQRFARRFRERRPAEIGVQHRPGGVDDRDETGCARRQIPKHVIDELIGRQRPVAHPALRCMYCLAHTRPPETALRVGEPRVG